MKKILIPALIAILSSLPALNAADISYIPEGYGSRAVSLGETYTSIANDASAVFWNPAGLIQLQQKEFDIFYNFYRENNRAFINFAYPTEKSGAFGAGFSRHANFSELVQSTTVQTEGENLIFLSYGRKFNPKLSAGLTFKTFQRSEGDLSDSAVTADLGVLYKPIGNIVMGFSGKNLLDANLEYGAQSYNLPNNFRVGLTYYLQIWREKLPLEKFLPIKKVKSTSLESEELLLSIDIEKDERSDVFYCYRGLEFWLHDILAFRLGPSREPIITGNTWNCLFGIQNPTIGFGLKLDNFQLDFSYARPDHPMSIQFTFKFGEKIAGLEYNAWEIEKRAQQYVKTGEMNYQNGKIANALSEWEKALIWTPNDVELQDKINNAQKTLEEETNKKLVENYINQAYVKYAEGNLLESLDNWQKIIEIDPENKRAKEYIDRINSKLTEVEKKKFSEDLQQKQREKIAQYSRNADTNFEREKYREAIAEWEKVLKVEPANQEARDNIEKTKSKVLGLASMHYDKAMDYLTQADKLNAIKELRLVLTYDSGHKEARENLAKLKQEVKPAKIVDVKEVIVDKKEINQLYYRAADLYLAGNYSESEKILNSLLAIDPFNENAVTLLEKVKSVMETMRK